MASWLAAVGFVIVLVTGARWVRLLRAVAVPQRKRGFVRAFGSGAGLAGVGLVLGAGGIAAVAGWIALVVGGAFCALQLTAAQDRREPAVQVGRPMLDFTAPAADGGVFEAKTLRGRPYLLKFFRGHW